MRSELVVLVYGGRHYPDRKKVFDTLDEIDATVRIRKVVEGQCQVDGKDSGADRWAHEWAVERGRETQRYPADWDRYGLAAGPIRNRQMAVAENPDVAVGFPGGRGSKSMYTIARELKIEIMEIR